MADSKQLIVSENLLDYSSIPLCDFERRDNINNYRKNRWLTILFGQIIALVAASANAASFTLEYGMKRVFPMFLLLLVYLILSLNLWNREPIKDQEAYRVPFTPIRLRSPWWHYVCLSALDFFPNYLTLISLKHTSLTSATLLGSLTIPSTMVVCSAILSKRFKSAHYFGVFLCLTGGGMTLLNDSSHSLSKTPSSHPYSYYGDILAILAAILYGIGDAAGEFWTKHIDRKEYLGMLGLHGSVVSLMLFLIFERNTIEAIFIDTPTFMTTLSMLIWYVPSVVLFYTLATLFLVSSDATLLSLSLQSSNLWAILFSTLAFRESPPLSFCFAAIFVAAGVSIYELLGNAHQATTLDPDEV